MSDDCCVCGGGMPVELGVICIGAGIAIAVSLGVAVWFERWKAKQPDPTTKQP